MMLKEPLDTHAKALALNLDPSIFGSFAEIGAGQETARWFLRVGAASGTVAKTICAYDKAVSDDLYGAGSRYVAKDRLQAMLATEWELLEKQIASRSANVRSFVFANTIAARNYAGTNQCHGWLGIQFRHKPNAEPSGILVHVNLWDSTNVLQQESLGVLGVNLIYGAYYQSESADTLLSGLGENSGLTHLDIDYIETYGELFQGWEQKLLFAKLVCSGLAYGVLLPHQGDYLALNEAFYKTALVVEPGHFEEEKSIYTVLLNSAVAQLSSLAKSHERSSRAIFCLFADRHDPVTLLDRAEKLLATGYDVLLTRHAEMYQISKQLRAFTRQPLRFVVGLSFVVRLIDAAYSELQGRVLEGLGRLFAQDVAMYVHPMSKDLLYRRVPEASLQGWEIEEAQNVVEADQVHPPLPLGLLYQYLLTARLIEPLRLLPPDTTE